MTQSSLCALVLVGVTCNSQIVPMAKDIRNICSFDGIKFKVHFPRNIKY